MTPDELKNTAHNLINERLAAGEIVQMTWAVQELIAQQGEIWGGGVAFFKLCAREHVYRIVKNAVDKYNQSEGEDPHPTLPGYECLQKAYTVDRDGDRQLVPIELITNEELFQRAREFRKQSKTLDKHAEELEEYVARRNERAA